jgi:hypothetical protein
MGPKGVPDTKTDRPTGVVSLTALRRTQVKTLFATIHVAFVVRHGNPVYRAVTWIPICVSVTWSPVLPISGRFPWEAPTKAYLSYLRFIERDRMHTLLLRI